MKSLNLLLFFLILAACGKPLRAVRIAPSNGRIGNAAGVLTRFDKSIEKSWRLDSRTIENARSSQEFIALQEKYPAVLAKYDAAKVTTAEIAISNYKFVGTTSCAADDVHLNFQSTYYDICLGPKSCEKSVLYAPSDRDPCAKP